MYKVEVTIKRRSSILDPQGIAVEKGALHLGLNNISETRIGKFIEFVVSIDDREKAETEVDEYCKKLLANPNMEDYEFKMEKL